MALTAFHKQNRRNCSWYTNNWMRNHPLHFLAGFALGYLPVLFLLANLGASVPGPYAGASNEGHITVVLETLEPEGEKSPVLAASADLLKPEARQTSTPEPTAPPAPLPTETPVSAPTATPDVWSPPEYEPWFSQYAGQYGVDKNMLERIANCESHFDANAQNGANVGMFQFTPGTWEKYRKLMGLDANPDLRLNAEESIKTAAYLLQQRGPVPWPSCLR